jgi:Skp family chaperone for outer membrane proteins
MTTLDEVIQEEVIEQTVEEEVETSIQQEENDPAAKLKAIQEELDKKSELVKQLRKYERQQKEEKEKLLKEQGNFKELYESTLDKFNILKTQLLETKINTAIEEVAKSTGVKSLSTLNKIIDKSSINVDDNGNVEINSVKDLIKGLQKTDPLLFELADVKTPSVKKANEDVAVSNYEVDLRKAKTAQEIEAVLKKYGKF